MQFQDAQHESGNRLNGLFPLPGYEIYDICFPLESLISQNQALKLEADAFNEFIIKVQPKVNNYRSIKREKTGFYNTFTNQKIAFIIDLS